MRFLNKIRRPMIRWGLYRRVMLNPRFLLSKIIESKRLKTLKNIYAGKERCFVIGNGPSIQNQDLTKLKDEVTFATNWFVLHKQYENICPKYYCISDPRLFYDKKIAVKLLKLLSEKALQAEMFFPLRAQSKIKKSSVFKNNRVWYLDYILYPIWESKEVSLNIHKGVFTGDTVIIDFCLPIAYYMGFKKIYLLGCDCSLGKNDAKEQNKRHFYDESEHISQQRSDLYLKDQWLQRVIVSYETVRQTFENSGKKVYNAGNGGKLEVFERVEYDHLFRKA